MVVGRAESCLLRGIYGSQLDGYAVLGRREQRYGAFIFTTRRPRNSRRPSSPSRALFEPAFGRRGISSLLLSSPSPLFLAPVSLSYGTCANARAPRADRHSRSLSLPSRLAREVDRAIYVRTREQRTRCIFTSGEEKLCATILRRRRCARSVRTAHWRAAALRSRTPRCARFRNRG